MALTTAQRTAQFGPPGQVDRVTYATPWGPKVSIHPQILARFRAACEKASKVSKWRPQRIDSYNPRRIRGSSSWSLHAWAMAFDFFATPPDVYPPGGVWTPDDPPPPEFVKCFTELGFRWGGTFARVDTPHIEWADGLPAPLPAIEPSEEEDMPSPAIVTVGGKTFTFIKGVDNGLHVHDGTSWRGLGGVLSSAPSATVGAGGLVELAVRGKELDGPIYRATFNPADGSLSGWKSIGGKS